MNAVLPLRRVLTMSCAVTVVAAGCSFQGVNSLPLPGAVGRGADAKTYHVEIANVATLESNSPVLIDDVVVGSVGRIRFSHWHADVEISVKPDVEVPANAVATVGQTSLLGSMHLALDPPPGQPPRGTLASGATLALDDSSTYPSTEQTLSSLSAVVNGGGLGQLGDIIHSTNTALTGRQDQVRDLIARSDRFVGTLDAQRDDLVAALHALDRLSGTLAGQRDVISGALKHIPPALQVLDQERPRLTSALAKLGNFSDVTTQLVRDSKDDLVKNLTNLAPTLQALADVGPHIDAALAYVSTFPYGQDLIDRGVRGDYMNLFATFDLTVPRLKRTLLLGTRFGELHAPLRPAPGDPYYATYSFDPLHAPLAPAAAPPSDEGAMPPMAPAPADDAVPPPAAQPILPMAPPNETTLLPPTGGAGAPIFAGPYGSSPSPSTSPAQPAMPLPGAN